MCFQYIYEKNNTTSINVAVYNQRMDFVAHLSHGESMLNNNGIIWVKLSYREKTVTASEWKISTVWK